MILKARKKLTALVQKFWGLWKEMRNNEEMQLGLRFWIRKEKCHGEWLRAMSFWEILIMAFCGVV